MIHGAAACDKRCCLARGSVIRTGAWKRGPAIPEGKTRLRGKDIPDPGRLARLPFLLLWLPASDYPR